MARARRARPARPRGAAGERRADRRPLRSRRAARAAELPQEVQQKLSVQHDVVDLTGLLEVLAAELLVHDRAWLEEIREALVDERQPVSPGPLGITTAGRSSGLRVNYRPTEGILAWSTRLLASVAVDAL